jgi:hypothetical protein
MFDRKTESEKQHEKEQEELEEREAEKEMYSRKFFVEIVEGWDTEEVEKDIDEKAKHGFEPASITNIYNRYDLDDLAILYKKMDSPV